MSKKIVYCLLVLSLAAVANATPITFGTWEDSNNGYIDWGQGQASITTLPSKYSYSTTGATHGDKALRMADGIGWQQNLAVRSYQDPLAGYPNGIVAGALTEKYVAVDVTWVQSEWTVSGSGSYSTVELTIQGTGLSWTGMGRPDVDTGNPGYPGGWDGVNYPGVHTRTMFWNITAYHDGNPDNGELTATPTNGYVNFIFTTNAGNFSSGGVYYFDNMRLVPEPATIALLGLGAFVLRRRK